LNRVARLPLVWARPTSNAISISTVPMILTKDRIGCAKS
jgi:hypothetical protein